MKRGMLRALRVVLIVILGVVLLVPVAVLVLTRTTFGRERVRRFALSSLREAFAGRIDVGAIEGDLLGRFSLLDLSIADSAGGPVLRAERVTAQLNARAFISRRINLSELTLVRPVLHLIQSPDGEWNYKRLLAASDSTLEKGPGFGDWITARDMSLVDGTLIVQQPWSDSGMTIAGRDSLLSGKARARVEAVEYGLQQTMDFRKIHAHLPIAIIADPDSNDMTFDVDTLSMIAAPFRPPEFDVRQFAGQIHVADDAVRIRNASLMLPGSRAVGTLDYVMPSGDILARFAVDTLALRDIRGAYPALPDSGGGKLALTATIRADSSSEYDLTDLSLRVGRSSLTGRIGLVLGEPTTAFRNTDVRFTNLTSTLVEQLAPTARSRIAGEATGRARLEGDLTAMRLDLDAQLDPVRHPAFHVTARGGVGVTETAFSARSLRVDARRVPVSLAREFGIDSLPIGGTMTVGATASGSTNSAFRGRFAASHVDGDAVSALDGEGTVNVRDSTRLDARIRLRPISLELVQRFAPETEVQGEVTGTAHITGPARNLVAALDLSFPADAVVRGDVRLTTPREGPAAYGADLTVGRVDLHAMLPSSPATDLNGSVVLRARGEKLATVEGELRADLTEVRIDSSAVGIVTLVAQARSGTLVVDTLSIVAPFGSASAQGNFGLTEEHGGTLRYRADLLDLAGLSRWIGTADTASVPARPGIAARLARLAVSADSVQRASRQDPASQLAADLAGGKPVTRPTLPSIPPVPGDSLSGRIIASGEATGHVKRFDVGVTATSEGVVWGGNLFGAGSVRGTWFAVGTPDDSVAAEGGVDSLRVAGFALDSTRFKLTWRGGSGDAEVVVFPGDTAEYRISAEYALRTGEREIRLREIELRFDSTGWHSTRPSRIAWGGQGLVIDSLELRNRDGRGGGRIFVNGEVPDVDDGRLEIAIDSLRVAPWLTLTQSDLPVDGSATFASVITGTRNNPRLEGELRLTNASYRATGFPDTRVEFDYADRRMNIGAAMTRANGDSLARLAGTIPIDLRLTDSVTRRLGNGPIDLTIEGDSIPLSPLKETTDLFTLVEGRAFGRVLVKGTWEEPDVSGTLGAELPRLGIASTNVTLESVVAAVQMEGETLVIDSVTARSVGTLWAGGNVHLKELDHPVFDLAVAARGARVLDDDRGELYTTANLRLGGTPDTVQVRGHATITRGVVYLPDPDQFNIISTDDPAVFAVVDTATARELDVVARPINVLADVDLEVGRGTFARSPEANVEVYGTLNLFGNPTTASQLALTGSLFTDYGQYTYLGKRFDVLRGSVRFTGGTDLNPALQVMATYKVQQAGRPPLDIRVLLGGTLERPTVALESDAQPTLSQSDLISFLAFGRSSSSLLQFSGTGLSGGGQGGSSLAGNVAALASRQLASISLGAVADQIRHELAGATGADVLNVRPAELPADLTQSQWETLLRGTEIEIGKYVDRRTFVVTTLRPTAVPGALVERRLTPTLELSLNFESRFLPTTPSLGVPGTPRTLRVLGAILAWTVTW